MIRAVSQKEAPVVAQAEQQGKSRVAENGGEVELGIKSGSGAVLHHYLKSCGLPIRIHPPKKPKVP